ncbi:MAG TPA: hypothetical protein VIB39_16745 [Candidatus Angelobacter sp.]|jgi:hypothetical protein
MQTSDQNAYSDELLTRYLLGDLPADQTEKLDELSIADDEFAWRLNGVENDLVDEFVRGELHGDNLNRFRSFYLSSPGRRQKVEFAAGLLELKNRAAVEVERPKSFLSRTSWWRAPGLFRQWSFAAAALALLLAAYLLTDNLRLRHQMDEAAANHSSLEQELTRQRAANAQIQSELEHAHGTTSVVAQLNTVALLLAPPTRGVGHIETVPIHKETDFIVLFLALESDDFPRYKVALKDPSSGRVMWQSAELESTVVNGKKAVSASLPAGQLRAQTYIAELSGIGKAGNEVAGSYPFRVVLR